MFLTALASIGGSILGGILSNESADKSSDAIAGANEKAIALQREQFNWIKSQLTPTIQMGNQARGIWGEMFGIQNGTGNNAMSLPSSYTGTAYSSPSYQNPVSYTGVNSRVSGLPPGVRNALSPEQQAQYMVERDPYFTMNGRNLTGTTAAQQPQKTEAEIQQGAYDRFLDSGYNKAATEVSQNDFDTIKGSMGAGGKLFSGSALGAMGDRLSSNRYGALFDYNNALANLAGAGQSATSAVGSAGQNYASNAGNALMNIGNAKASSYAQQGQNTKNMIGGVLGGLGSFF